jgi:hypothetical protein
MARNVMKYRLTAEGTVPEFLYLGQDGVGGVYGVNDPNTPWPRNLVQIGITNDNATGDFEAFPNKASLLTYLTEVGANWTQQNPATPNDITNRVPFDPNAATDWVWNRFTALGGV